jgi:hypothetical protein
MITMIEDLCQPEISNPHDDYVTALEKFPMEYARELGKLAPDAETVKRFLRLFKDTSGRMEARRQILDVEYTPEQAGLFIRQLANVAVMEETDPTPKYRGDLNHFEFAQVPRILALRATYENLKRYYTMLGSEKQRNRVRDYLFGQGEFDYLILWLRLDREAGVNVDSFLVKSAAELRKLSTPQQRGALVLLMLDPDRQEKYRKYMNRTILGDAAAGILCLFGYHSL